MNLSIFGLWIRLIQGIFQRNHPSFVVFFVTGRCNCRCSTCFNWRNVWESNDNKVELSLDEINKIALSLKPLPQLTLSGGEPFLREDIQHIIEAFYYLSGTRQIVIPTNGILTDQIELSVKSVLSKCPDLFLNLSLSLNEIEDRRDHMCNVVGSFEKLCETYSRLAMLRKTNKRLSLTFVTVIMRSNIERIDQIIKFARKSFDANYHSLIFVRGDLHQEAKIEELAFSEKQEKDYYINLPFAQGVSFLKSLNFLATSIYRATNGILLKNQKLGKRCFCCLAGSKIIVLTQSGKIMPCEPLWLEKSCWNNMGLKDCSIADLSDFNFDVAQALRSQQAINIKREIRNNNCYCQYGCAVFNSLIYAPSMYPLLFRQIITDLLK